MSIITFPADACQRFYATNAVCLAMTINRTKLFAYEINPEFSIPVDYFSMEFAIDQALKNYNGGLGFLSGSHLKSAFQLKQNLIGVGLLWKYGYYDQERDGNGQMKTSFIEKTYSFMEDIGLLLTLQVHNSPVYVRAYLLRPRVFATAPLFLLSTDIPENEELSRSITHYLYDANEATRIAQSIVLGIGGATLLDELDLTPAIYHLNEGYAVALNFYLYNKYKVLQEVRKRVVFTTHTPEKAGNDCHLVVSFDLHRHGYSKWCKNAIKDLKLSLRSEVVDKDESNAALSRKQIFSLILNRYTLAA